jgi:hypothetical protein
MTTPVRIQLRRSKGWRMPAGAVKVDRTTPFGNPFVVGRDGTREECVRWHRLLLHGYILLSGRTGPGELRGHMHWVYRHLHLLRDATALACWCPEGAPCHADTLIEVLAAVEAERLDAARRRRAVYAQRRRLAA